MQSGQNDTTQSEPFAHWRKGHLFRFAVRDENMPHRTMGHLSQRELPASRGGLDLFWVTPRRCCATVNSFQSELCIEERAVWWRDILVVLKKVRTSCRCELGVTHVLWYFVHWESQVRWSTSVIVLARKAMETLSTLLKAPRSSAIGFGGNNIDLN